VPTIVPGVLFPPNAEVRAARGTTVIREVQCLPGDREPGTGDRAELLDAIGCEVIDLRLGATDVRALAPGRTLCERHKLKRKPSEGSR